MIGARGINPTPHHRARIKGVVSGRLVSPNERIGSVGGRESLYFFTLATDAEDPLLGSRTVMMSLKNYDERDPLPAG